MQKIPKIMHEALNTPVKLGKRSRGLDSPHGRHSSSGSSHKSGQRSLIDERMRQPMASPRDRRGSGSGDSLNIKN